MAQINFSVPYKPKIYFLTFGEKVKTQNISRHISKILIFDEIQIHSDENLKKNKIYRYESKELQYELKKKYFINNILHIMNEFDILIYVDDDIE